MESKKIRPVRLHLLGGGAVGRAFMEQVASDARLQLIRFSDSQTTVHCQSGLDLPSLIELKTRRQPIATLPGATTVEPPIKPELSPVDVVVDCTDSRLDRGAEALHRSLAIIDSGRRLVLAAKNGLLTGTEELLSAPARRKLGLNAVLGGTGKALLDNLDDIRDRCREIVLVPNATTSVIIETIEQGGSYQDGVDVARQRDLLEADPDQDLKGIDAALKLVIVTRAVFERPCDLPAVTPTDMAFPDTSTLQTRRQRGATTRLVCRATATMAAIAYEELPASSALAVGGDRVGYRYDLEGSDPSVFIGNGVGPNGTARAIVEDLEAWL